MEDSPRRKTGFASRWEIWIFIAIFFLGCCLVTGCVVYIGSAVWFVQRANADADGTATAAVKAIATGAKKAQLATQTAYGTATAGIPKFNLVDSFDSNQNGWSTGKSNDEFWVGESNVENGVYAWDVQQFKKSFLNYSDFSNSPTLKDFDVSVETKIINGTNATCSGIIFRKSPGGLDDGAYAISVCKSHQFLVGYIEKGKWLNTSKWITSSSIKDDWNKVEVNARGSRLICKINGFILYEMDDSHRSEGNVALFVEIHQENGDSRQGAFLVKSQNAGGTTLLFDNFHLQGR